MGRWIWAVQALFGAGLLLAIADHLPSSQSDGLSFPNYAGQQGSYRANGTALTLSGPFFQPLAASGRSCSSCHRPEQGWSLSAEGLQTRFVKSEGLDPVFRKNDGANCDHGLDTSTVEARRAAYSLLIDRGVIRISLPVPANAQFEVAAVRNLYGCGERDALSLYRRPLPATNLAFLTSVMWDGRESSLETGTQPLTGDARSSGLAADLAHQALDAAKLHAQAEDLSPQQQEALVAFEMSLVTAQEVDREAGPLGVDGAKGGAAQLARAATTFFVGINDRHGGDPHGIKAENAFRLFDDWSKLPYGRVYQQVPSYEDERSKNRDRIARGQVLFNQKPFDIRGVAGLNDKLNLVSITGACGTCHNTPNAGNHSVPAEMNTGTADPGGLLDLSYLPKFTLRKKASGEVRFTTDPGRSLVTGKWDDVGKVKIPVLRGLAARAPYFHNGSARSLSEVVDFYNRRFQIGLSERDQDDLIAFLNAL